MSAPDILSLNDKVDVSKRLEELTFWQKEWRIQEANLDQKIAEIGDSIKEFDVQKSAEIAALRNRLELQQVRIPLEISPETIKALGYGKLRQHMVTQFVQLSQEERLLWLNNFLFILTPDLRKLNDKITRIRGYRSFGQKRNFLLGAVSGMGKTTYLHWFVSHYLPQVESERNRILVIMIDAPEGNSPKHLFQRLIRACGANYLERDTEEMLLMKIALYLQKCGVEVIVIDEVEHIKNHSVRRRLLELSNMTHHVPIICSSCEPQEWIKGDPEIEGRWNDYFRIERYTGARLQQLLVYINLLLPLPQNSFLSSDPKKQAHAEGASKDAAIAFIQRVTRGKLGNIMLLIREATRAAVEENLSCLDEALLRKTWDDIQTKPATIEKLNGEGGESPKKEEE
jgi:hypothetical protein